MVLFYVFSISLEKYIILFVLAAVFHFFSLLTMIILAFADPGFIPKIHGTYEYKDFRRIPIS